MSNIRRCYNGNCEYNIDGTYCDVPEIVIGADGCCEDFRPKKNDDDFCSYGERRADNG